MTQLTAAEIAMAFTAQNDKKGWLARTNAKPDKGMDLVHFTAPSQLISLTYNAMDGKFMVRFHKLHASWGDYIKSIAKTLYYILTVLKAAGLPFEAPLSAAGIQIIATASDDNTVYVEWPDMHRGGFRAERLVAMRPELGMPYGGDAIDVVQ
jgi:hypothetical protein